MNFQEILQRKYGGLPVWAWGLIAVAGVGIGIYLYRRTKTTPASQSTSAANTTPGDTSSLSSGINQGYGDYQASGGNANTPGNTTINVGVPSTPSNWLTTLNLTNSGPVPLYDQAGTPGTNQPGNQIGTIPGGSQVTATGPEQTGAWLTNNNSSELWYPVVYNGQAGFINAYYVANASSSINNSPVSAPTITTLQATASGPIADTPGGTKIGGKNLGTVNKGDTITLLSQSPVKNTYGTYYNVSTSTIANGWINAATIGK